MSCQASGAEQKFGAFAVFGGVDVLHPVARQLHRGGMGVEKRLTAQRSIGVVFWKWHAQSTPPPLNS